MLSLMNSDARDSVSSLDKFRTKKLTKRRTTPSWRSRFLLPSLCVDRCMKLTMAKCDNNELPLKSPVMRRISTRRKTQTIPFDATPNRRKTVAQKTGLLPIVIKFPSKKFMKRRSTPRSYVRRQVSFSARPFIEPDQSIGLVQKTLNEKPVFYWTSYEVFEYFYNKFPEHAYVFNDHELDGNSLCQLERNDVVHGFKIRLGPALKIYNEIQYLLLNVPCK